MQARVLFHHCESLQSSSALASESHYKFYSLQMSKAIQCFVTWAGWCFTLNESVGTEFILKVSCLSFILCLENLCDDILEHILLLL